MPKVNPEILRWARETAGMSPEAAVHKLDLPDARGATAVERLAALEEGRVEPTRPMLVKMAKQYRRPLVVFYMSAPPRRGDRGQDFRTLPTDHSDTADALLDALIRDVRARQSMIRAALEDAEEAVQLPFVGSLTIATGVPATVAALQTTLQIDRTSLRSEASPDDAFDVLRATAERAGIFVLLIGNLGSQHSAIDLETFRGFALSDTVCPLVVINDQDARAAWSFTLLHELTHLLLGQTGVSGARAELAVERFCNDVAGEFLLPTEEILQLRWDGLRGVTAIGEMIGEFARARNLSNSMVAYRLYLAGRIDHANWMTISTSFRDRWFHERTIQRERNRDREGGPNYYVVRRHRVGTALVSLVTRMLSAGVLTTSKAGKVLGVKATQVQSLLGVQRPGGTGEFA